MSAILNAWSISGAALGAVGSLASSAFTQSVSGEGVVKIGLITTLVGGGLGLAAESLYNQRNEPTPISTAGECVKNAPQGYTISINKDGTCSYSPK